VISVIRTGFNGKILLARQDRWKKQN